MNKPVFQIIAGTGALLVLLLVASAIWLRLSNGTNGSVTPTSLISPTSPAQPGLDITGSYDIVGTNLQGQMYEGTLNIQPSGTVYQLSWETNAGNYTGTAILYDTTLAVTYGQAGLCNVVAYKIQNDGTLDGLWVEQGQTVLAREVAEPSGEVTSDDVTGSYIARAPDLVERLPDLDVPPEMATQIVAGGELTIEQSGDTYQFVWDVGQGDVTGTGIRQNDILSAVFGAPGRCGLVVYDVEADGVLDGVWTPQGQSNIGTEQAVPAD